MGKTTKKKYAAKELEGVWNQVPPNYYQEGVAGSSLQRKWHFGKLNNVLRLLPQAPHTILDVGCASGWFLSQVAKKYPAARCIGVDPYAKAIDYGKRKYPRLELIRADGHLLPFADDQFDVVICTEVLEHVISPDKVLREICRVLKSEGTVIIEMDSGNFLFRAVWYWWTHIRCRVWHDAHIHVFTPKKLKAVIANSGLVILRQRLFNWTMAVVFQCQKRSIHRQLQEEEKDPPDSNC